jgi:hypothetical protein
MADDHHSKGGIARAAKLSPEERSSIARHAALSRHKKDMPKAVAEGVLEIGDLKIPRRTGSYALSDGTPSHPEALAHQLMVHRRSCGRRTCSRLSARNSKRPLYPCSSSPRTRHPALAVWDMATRRNCCPKCVGCIKTQ